jgi:hypothetical protein
MRHKSLDAIDARALAAGAEALPLDDGGLDAGRRVRNGGLPDSHLLLSRA